MLRTYLHQSMVQNAGRSLIDCRDSRKGLNVCLDQLDAAIRTCTEGDGTHINRLTHVVYVQGTFVLR